MDELYNDKPDGLCGNEDCGQMSAWYVLSAMGFYPVTPGSSMYAIGSPLFDNIVLNLASGKTFSIEVKRNTPNSIYIQSAKLNGKKYNKFFISHQDIINGGILVLEMGTEPNADWGTGKDDMPVSAINEQLIMPVPYIDKGKRTFIDRTMISMGSSITDSQIFYTTDGSEPSVNSTRYEIPFIIDQTTTIKAVAHKDGMPLSHSIKSEFYKIPIGRSITLYTHYANQYSAGGDLALIDFIRGPLNFRTGAWQGYEGVDLDAVIDLGSIQLISNIEAGFLLDVGAWIFFPEQVDFAVSSDGKNYQQIASVKNDISEKDTQVQIKNFKSDLSLKARYIRVKAKNRGICPVWHWGAGQKAWIFADEIVIK
jgi:hypothetical protein